MQIVNHGFFMDWEEGGDGKCKDKNEGEEHQPQREPLMAQDHSAKEATMPLPDGACPNFCVNGSDFN